MIHSAKSVIQTPGRPRRLKAPERHHSGVHHPGKSQSIKAGPVTTGPAFIHLPAVEENFTNIIFVSPLYDTMNFEQLISKAVADYFLSRHQLSFDEKLLQIQKTRKEFIGDFTLVVFPFASRVKRSPEQLAGEIGHYLEANLDVISSYNIIKGFLNLLIERSYWLRFIQEIPEGDVFGHLPVDHSQSPVLVEFSSPNTNKPLHLGHIRNNLLGQSISRILEANGKRVVRVNLVNDRGIHICKSMLAWQKWGQGQTPSSTGKKGDHLVGDFYVLFEKKYQEEIADLVKSGLDPEIARNVSPLLEEAKKLLIRWENNDAEVITLWRQMNSWVYEGFERTYRELDISFDKIYYESDTYLLGKKKIHEALSSGLLAADPDGSVWIDLTKDGLDRKILLRSDGTSVYITQDIGTAIFRFEEFHPSEMLYVVGNEQEYHFNVLKLVMKSLGYSWHDSIRHLSYGMVELPHGKMKSREGTIVDADQLLQEMRDTAASMSAELGKLEGYPEEERERIVRMIGYGALKYFILKVDPKKNMMFNPSESIDFNGNTGPFVQYTHARIQSIFRRAQETGVDMGFTSFFKQNPNEKELFLIRMIYEYPSIIREAGLSLSPALIANYLYELAREYNQFYHDSPILREQNESIRSLRLNISFLIARILKSGMRLLGIDVPERM
jgi:arginyl-tRNA synthetase